MLARILSGRHVLQPLLRFREISQIPRGRPFWRRLAWHGNPHTTQALSTWFCDSHTQSPLAPEGPIHAAAWPHDTVHLLAKLLFECRPPRHQLEAESVVDHGEAARRKRHALAIDAGDMLTVGGGAMREPGVGRKLCDSL